MIQRSFIWALASLGLTAVVAGTLWSVPAVAGAQRKNEQNSTFGYVDLARVTDQIKKSPTWVTVTKKYTDDAARFEAEIKELSKLRYLTPAERQQLDALRAKTNANPTEKARIAELEAKSDALDKEFQTLATIEKPTPKDGDRLKELQKMREDALLQVQAEIEQRQAKLSRMQEDVLEEMQKKILEHVGKIAQGKNLGLVVDRQAVLFGGTDITEDVLKKLDVK